MVTIDNLNHFLIYQPEMKITSKQNKNYTIEGIYSLSSLYKDIYLHKKYTIKIKVPIDYPKTLPQVFDVDNIIPKEFEHFYIDGSLCLGSPMELYLSALQHGINEFLLKHIDSYLYSLTYFKKYNNQFPYGERSHGLMGILEFWKEYLKINEFDRLYNVMTYISKDNYRGHSLCPCGSKNKVRDCHGDQIFPIIKNCLSSVVKAEINLFDNYIKKNFHHSKLF